MASTKLDISELDFDAIKVNLKNFLSKQSEFSDYNFEGSGFAILLDLLAYNTHYLGFNANMLANEMYLDSADIRKNIVSLAKMLGYTPLSAKSPIANATSFAPSANSWVDFKFSTVRSLSTRRLVARFQSFCRTASKEKLSPMMKAFSPCSIRNGMVS